MDLKKIAKQMKEMAKRYPVTVNTKPHEIKNRHTIKLSRGLIVEFTLMKIDEPTWHLRIYRKDVPPSNLECKICCKNFFGCELPIENIENSEIKDRHFYMPLSRSNINNG